MKKPWQCVIGLHAWHGVKDKEDQFLLVQCLRCGKEELPSTNVMARIGWPGHTL